MTSFLYSFFNLLPWLAFPTTALGGVMVPFVIRVVILRPVVVVIMISPPTSRSIRSPIVSVSWSSPPSASVSAPTPALNFWIFILRRFIFCLSCYFLCLNLECPSVLFRFSIFWLYSASNCLSSCLHLLQPKLLLFILNSLLLLFLFDLL